MYSYKEVLILVEGQTEKLFVDRILVPHLTTKNILAIPKIITTKIVKDGTNFKGGISRYAPVKQEIIALLGNRNALLVTTMLDFARIPPDFPGYATMPKANCHQRIAFLTSAFQQDIKHPKFLAYFALHEFEALLFTQPDKIAIRLALKPSEQQTLHSIKNSVPSPEEINEQDYPSLRLKKIQPTYNKILDGLSIAEEIGLAQMRQECPHFNNWITSLEKIGTTNG